MKRHICILWCFENHEHIAKCFESIQMDDKDYFIVENRSQHSKVISEYFADKRLAGYIQFVENIADNAVKIFFAEFKEFLLQYEYITFSDGDLFLSNATDTFQEIWQILQHPEVGVCTVDLRLNNFPHHIAKPSDWLPAPTRHTADYVECQTGSHLLTLKRENLDILAGAPKAIDGCFRAMCAAKGLCWVKTKVNKAYHLTWDYYVKGNPYYEFRKKNPNIFNQERTCSYKQIV